GAVIGPPQALLLKGVSNERIVCVEAGQTEAGVGVLPAQPPEELPHVRGRVRAPAVLEKQVGGAVPAQTLGIRAAMFEFPDLTSETAAGKDDFRMSAAPAVLALQRQRAAERIQSKQRV